LRLEFLDYIDVQVADVASVTLDGVSKASSSVGSLINSILELLIASQEIFQLMTSGILVHTNTAGDIVFGLEGTVCYHTEDINHIMGQAVGAIVTALSSVVHLESTS